MNNNSSHDESENPPPGQEGTFKDRIDAALTRIEEDLNRLREYERIDELSANEIEQSKARYYGVYVRLLTLCLKVITDEAESESTWFEETSQVSIMGEPKITPGKPCPERVATPEDVEG
jgi:hypothetical protein